jgi:hypothetical protein
MEGINWKGKSDIRSATVRGYLVAAVGLFLKRGFDSPINLEDKNEDALVLIHNREREETIAKQRKPLDTLIFAELILQGKEEGATDIWLVSKVTSLGRVIGPRAGEYSQKTQYKVEVHEYPSGKKEIKALTRNDFIFLDKSGRRISTFNSNTRARVARVRIKFRIQKNRQNGQEITAVCDRDNPDICPVLAAFDLYMHSIEIEQPDDLPLVAMLDDKRKIKYLTYSKVASVLRKIAKKVHPDWSQEEINKISAHSIRVWACVLLDEAGKLPSFIKSRLRWLGESYRTYLRDTAVINEQHNEALKKTSDEVLALLLGNLDDSLLPAEVEEDEEMGEYIDSDE